jgi:phosphatidylserine/phosphatidylglycerophosphate/cardiolipin synthase-like enzyme
MIKYLVVFCLVGLTFSAMGQADILDARNNFDIDDEVTVTGIVTNDDGLGTVRYIQDGSAGVAVYPGNDWDGFDDPQIGDEITVTGVLTEFNGLLEVGPDLSVVTVNSSGNALPAFQTITPDQFGEDLEGELVTLEGCFFEIAGGCEFGGGAQTMTGNTTYPFISAGEQGVVFVRTDNPLEGEILPTGETTLYGIISQFSFSGVGGYQLLARDIDDMIGTSAINFASVVDQYDIATDVISLQWSTDIAGDSKVEYGTTMALGMEVFDATETTDHQVMLEGLDAGTIYYVRSSSTSGDDTAESTIKPYATKSNSSGDIRVYFTKSVENSVATDENAVSLFDDMNDTIAAYILGAQHTLDLAIYNISDMTIVNAINTAFNNGIEVRYMAQGSNLNSGIASFEAGIPVHYRTDDEGSGMHNKFIIADADYEADAYVLTGSTNFTSNNLSDDFNNLIIFQDQSMARGYRLEFNEMWGSDGPEPDAGNSKFGANKTVNTPKKYVVGESPVEVYFSPTDNTTAAIQCAVESMQSSLNFCLLVLTRDELAEAIIAVDNEFVDTRGIIEQTSGTGSDFDLLVEEGVEAQSHEGVTGQLHHKYAIVDHAQTTQDPMVITGSHNWSSSAENVNDENTVVVHDARVANLYFQEFTARWDELVISVEEHTSVELTLYPNPVNTELTIVSSETEMIQFKIISFEGKVVREGQIQGWTTVDCADLSSGIYTITTNDGGASKFVKN